MPQREDRRLDRRAAPDRAATSAARVARARTRRWGQRLAEQAHAAGAREAVRAALLATERTAAAIETRQRESAARLGLLLADDAARTVVAEKLGQVAEAALGRSGATPPLLH